MENPVVAPTVLENDIKERMDELRRRKEVCMKECSALSKELADLEIFEKKKVIDGITLTPDKKLVDLLVERILDPLPDWKTKIDTLINISDGGGEGTHIRGGSYFEALFQIAVAIGVTKFGKVKKFYDIEKYKENKVKENYLYDTDILNATGKAHGIVDIIFEVDIGQDDEGNIVNVPIHSCGHVPPKQMSTIPHYFISVKNYRNEKSISKYDISEIYQQISIFSEYENKRIGVCIRNKERFMKLVSRTQKNYIKNSIRDNIIGYDEIMDAFDEFRTKFFISIGELSTDPDTNKKAIEKRVQQMFPKTNEQYNKPYLSLYFHQELIVESVVQRIQEVKTEINKGPHFLCIGVLPRGGKSFIAGGIIDKMRKQKSEQGQTTFNVLFLTSAISETFEQFKSDLITKFTEFSDFEFIDPRNQGQTYDETKNSFVFASRELTTTTKKIGNITVLKEEEVEEKESPITNVIKILKERLNKKQLKFDICFFDEAHVGISSEKVQDTFLRAFDEFKMPIVMMTATYLKPSMYLEDPKDLFVWSIEDIQDMRKLPTIGFDNFLNITPKPNFLANQQELVKNIIDFRRKLGETEEHISRPYINFPDFTFISLTVNPEIQKRFVEFNDGFNINDAFRLKDKNSDILLKNDYTQWITLFTEQSIVSATRILQFLTPEEEPVTNGEQILIGQERKYRALNQIFNIAHESGSRPIMGQPFSIMMFLPSNAGLIGEVCRVWAAFLNRSKYWKDNFVFLTLSVLTNPKYKSLGGDIEVDVKQKGILHREDYKNMSLKELIQKVEYEALKEGKGLVILTGDVGKMGISLKCVDVVCLMTDSDNSDDLIQKAYRALTDDPPFKKNGFVIDLNVKRIFRAFVKYGIENARRNPETVLDVNIEDNVTRKVFESANWGQDMFIEDEAARGESFEMIKKKIDTMILDNLYTRTSESKKPKVLDLQVDSIFKNETLKKQVILVLKNTKQDKQPSVGIEIERGEFIPDVPKSNAAAPPLPRAVVDKEEQSKEEIQLTENQLKQKLHDIILTFINTLVIKSSNSLNSNFSFTDLIKKFEEDKKDAKKECDCDAGRIKCKIPHTNLYDIVYCELRPFAYSPSKVYLQNVHEGIMNLLIMLFKIPAGSKLSMDWQLYMGKLVTELSSKKGGRRKSWKKRHTKSNDRKTHRNGA
jgi:hypothetical protein